MKRFWPKSLLGQLMLVIALALAVAQAINFAMLYRAGERLRIVEAAGPVVARVGALAGGEPLGEFRRREGPRAGERRGRGGRGRRGGRRGGFHHFDDNSVVEAEALPRVARYEARLGEMMANANIELSAIQVGRVDRPTGRLARRIQRDTPPGWRPPELLRVSVQFEDGRWANGWMRVRPRGAAALGSIVFQSLILYLVVLAALYWVARRISRPLRSLTHAVERFDGETGHGALAPEGPRDVARLIEAHNAMRGRIAAMLGEKDHMLGAIGHDLRTPLAALRIRVENVEDDEQRERMIETIDDMSVTLEDILSLARLGRAKEESELLDLSSLVDTAIEDFRDIGADVTMEEADKIVVQGRSNLIKRAVRNLIDNAVRYGGKASVSIDAKDGQALVLVDDEGPGIATDKLESVFEPFARLDESRGSEGGGSGLGLALARAIARDHRGDISLENRSAGGLRARLALPLASA